MDKASFLESRLPTREVDLDGVGTVLVRALSRGEALSCKGLDVEELEQKVLAMGMVDPALAAGEVAVWYRNALTDEIKRVLDAIWDLSGLGEGAAKATYKSVPDEPG
jgi:hypothetical protein